MEPSEITVEQRGNVVWMTLNRPQALNALTLGMVDDFIGEWARIDADASVRVVVITGAGRAFCAGLDLKQNDTADRKRHHFSRTLNFPAHWIACLRNLGKPTIAAVNGTAVGGGLGLALGCDIRIASEEARFSAIFANIGMTVQDGVGALLPQAVGLSKALELIYTARIIGAREAERIGLVSEVVPPEDLLDRAAALAEEIAARPPVALAMSKRVVYASLARPFEDHLAYQNLATQLNATYAPHDLVEGGRAFRERRKPEFRGLEGEG